MDTIDKILIDQIIEKFKRHIYYAEDMDYLCNVLSTPNIGYSLNYQYIINCYKNICNFFDEKIFRAHRCIIPEEENEDWYGHSSKWRIQKIESEKRKKIELLNFFCEKLSKIVGNLIKQEELSAEEKEELITKIPNKIKFKILSSDKVDISAFGLNFQQEYNKALVGIVREIIEYPALNYQDVKTHNWLDNPSYYYGYSDNGKHVNLVGLQDIILKLEIVGIPDEIIYKYIVEVILSSQELNPSEYSKNAGSFLESISKSEENQYYTHSPLKTPLDAIYEVQVSGYKNQDPSSEDGFKKLYTIFRNIANPPSSEIELKGGFLEYEKKYKPQTKKIQLYFLKKYYTGIIEKYFNMTEDEIMNKVQRICNTMQQVQGKDTMRFGLPLELIMLMNFRNQNNGTNSYGRGGNDSGSVKRN